MICENPKLISKILGNVARDKRNGELLREAGWKVIIVWECELKKKCREETLIQLVSDIQSGQ